MVNRNDKNVAREIDRLSEEETSRIRKFSPETLYSRQNTIKDSSLADDVIGSLSDAYENKRARQVSEWERMRRFVQHAA